MLLHPHRVFPTPCKSLEKAKFLESRFPSRRNVLSRFVENWEYKIRQDKILLLPRKALKTKKRNP